MQEKFLGSIYTKNETSEFIKLLQEAVVNMNMTVPIKRHHFAIQFSLHNILDVMASRYNSVLPVHKATSLTDNRNLQLQNALFSELNSKKQTSRVSRRKPS